MPSATNSSEGSLAERLQDDGSLHFHQSFCSLPHGALTPPHTHTTHTLNSGTPWRTIPGTSPKGSQPPTKGKRPPLYHISSNLKQVPSTLALAESTVPPCHPLGLCPGGYCPSWLLKWNPPPPLSLRLSIIQVPGTC